MLVMTKVGVGGRGLGCIFLASNHASNLLFSGENELELDTKLLVMQEKRIWWHLCRMQQREGLLWGSSTVSPSG